MSARVLRMFNRLNKDEEISPWIRAPILLVSSWTFQGILQMERTERTFKVFLETLAFVPLTLMSVQAMPILTSILFATLIAHTINWTLNGQIPVVLRRFGLCQTDNESISRYLNALREKAITIKSIRGVYVFGSLSRGCISIGSDVDLRLVREHGLRSAVSVCVFAAKERFLSLLHRFPLDVYVLDSTESFDTMSERPYEVYDSSK